MHFAYATVNTTLQNFGSFFSFKESLPNIFFVHRAMRRRCFVVRGISHAITLRRRPIGWRCRCVSSLCSG